jgi:hypothetical protein
LLRAVNSILAEMKKHCQNGEYSNQTQAEGDFTKSVEDERSCQKSQRVPEKVA